MSISPTPHSPLPNRRKSAAAPGTIVHERRVASQIKPVAPMHKWLGIAGLVLLLAVVTVIASALWASRTTVVAPQHRAEAVCFALANRPVFDPPMSIECSATLEPVRFGTRVVAALQSSLSFRDEMVLQRSHERVGDFDVTAMWVALPESGDSVHWLVLGWIEGDSLAVCRFRFGGRGPTLGDEERVWGHWLTQRVLVPENFQATGFPGAELRLTRGQRLPRFGPAPRTGS